MLPQLDENFHDWNFIPDSAQEWGLSSPAHHTLLTGGRGWGKTEIQLMTFRGLVGVGYGAFWRGVIFDKEYKNLDDLVTKSQRLFNGAGDGAEWLASGSAFKWRWPTGEELLFRQAKKIDDYWDYHGHEYAFVGWNELTKYADNRLYLKMMSINRTGFDPEKHTPRFEGGDNWLKVRLGEWNELHKHYENRPFKAGDYVTPDGRPLPPIPLKVVSTTNPYGPGHNWVKREFIDVAPYGQITRRVVTVFNPKTKVEEPITRTQVAIFGTFRENPYLSPEYIAGLYEETDENIIKAWIKGDWDIVAGGAFDDVWKRPTHVVPRFKIPGNWHIDRALDWGSTQPCAIGWFAESNGEEVDMLDGSTRSWPRGTLIQFAELYVTKGLGTNLGLKMSAKDVARKVKKVEQELIEKKWITSKPSPGPADNQISNVTESDTETIEKKMADEGVRWTSSDKSKGSRKQGFQLMRDRLENSVRGEGAGLVFMDHCTASISTIPVLPRDEDDPDDVDSEAEDHAYDMVRYRVLKGNDRTAKVIHVTFPR